LAVGDGGDCIMKRMMDVFLGVILFTEGRRVVLEYLGFYHLVKVVGALQLCSPLPQIL